LSAATQHDLSELLTLAGSRIHGRRADCPDCSGKRTVSIDEGRGLFYCHHIGCGFSGGVGTLRKRLGIAREWIPRSEYLRQRQTQQRASEAAERLFYAVKARRLELQERLRELGRVELLAHEQGSDDPAAWDALAVVYAEQPMIEQGLDALEPAGVADAVRILCGVGELESAVR